MILVDIQNLSLNLGEIDIRDINLVLRKNQRMGIIAPNGAGKSTLLRSILNSSATSKGKISFAKGTILGLMTQEIDPGWHKQIVHDFVLSGLPEEARYETWRADIALEDLSIPVQLWSLPFSQLSGGWQRLAILARAWVCKPDVMLLDEPTNHLDLGKIAIVQHWMTRHAKETAMLIVSHDRAFLDDVSQRTLFLRPENSRLFDLPFTQAREALEKSDAFDEKTYAHMSAKADQLRKQAAKLKNIGVNSGSDLLLKKTKLLNQRAQEIEDTRKSTHQDHNAGTIRLVSSQARGNANIELRNLSVSTPCGAHLFNTDRLWINKGDRIFLLGANGLGKSTLLKRVIHAYYKSQKTIQISPSVNLGVFDQALDVLAKFETPFDAIKDVKGISDHAARTALANAGITYLMQDKPIHVLSGGQKARLAMVRLRLIQPNFYVLDEPTNHLDVKGQEDLTQELLAPEISALMVSHDRAFIREVGNRFWHIRGGKLHEVTTPEPYFSSIMDEAS